ncbi:glycosyltransferase 87 family protein [Nocardia takedensis]|uniref:glycosyltransferase 87 family protein n=1 Tax=Nocardia takedensis TaxID=259390 RepID=UPI000316A430|nr:glycosyltransferase 87 family protein [Nocardia takedensis]
MTERAGVANSPEGKVAAEPAADGVDGPGDGPLARYRSRWLACAIALFTVAAAVSLLVHWWSGYIDLQVYRNGARVWLDGGELYGPLPPVENIGLPFTYPPLAALFFAPLALMPLLLAEWVVVVTNIACLSLALWLVLTRIRPSLDRYTTLSVLFAAVGFAFFLEPVRQTFGFGQINLVLMTAIALDCLVRKPFWPRGMLIGVAVSIKLIPAGFLLYFLLRRDWKAAGTLVVSAAAAVGVGFLLFPRDSMEYWFDTLADTGRIGPPYFAGNQSIKGMTFRLGVSDSLATVLWIALAAVAVALAAVWMHRLIGAGATVAALLVNAAAVLLVSPVSWSHHWVWVAPALLVVADGIALGRRRRWYLWTVGALTVLFLIGPHWLLPHSKDLELEWAWWQQIIGSSYVLVTLAIFVAAVATYRPARVDHASAA